MLLRAAHAALVSLVFALAAAIGGEGFALQDAGTVGGTASQPASQAAEAAKDAGWPRQFETPTHTVLVHQPQVDEWPNFDRIKFRAAISVQEKNSQSVSYGILVISAKTDVAFQERLVVLSDRKVEQITFPETSAQETARLTSIVNAAAPPRQPQTVSLDRLIAALDASKLNIPKTEVNIAPPAIFASDKPAVMVIFIGKPRFKQVPGGDLLFAVNTNWDVFMDSATSTYYLLDDKSWLKTNDLSKGPWSPAGTLPAGLSKLPADDNWSDVRAAIPGTPIAEVPQVFVSDQPAELIVTKGAPELEPIPGTKLMLITNTENDLFLNTGENQYYLLAAGRWFKSAALAGPWSAASASLPDDFKKIPEDSDAADVLASVPGTPAANEAMIMASIPQKATVTKSEVTVKVVYQGEPDFRPIDGTVVKYAYNTPFNVFLTDGKYYCCSNAVWFISNSPSGPWIVADYVPPAIYSIPPTSSKYNVTYVHVYESTPTTVVTGYTAGYTGATVAATGAVMFGLGILVAELIDNDDCCWGYHYSSCFYSYGCGARWGWSDGGYVCAGARYGPYGGAGGFAAYNPSTGFYSRGAYAYGPRGAAGVRTAYNPSTGVGGYRAGATTPYGSWSRGAVSNGDDWVRGGTRSGPRGSAGAIEGSGGAALGHAEGRWGNGVTVGRTQDGDVYAGNDGKVYKKTDDGWEQQVGSGSRSTSSSEGHRATERSADDPKGTGEGVKRPDDAPKRTGENHKASGDSQKYLQQQSEQRSRGERNISREHSSGGGGAGKIRGGGGGRRR